MSGRRSPCPIVLDLPPEVCERDYEKLCNGIVPIPLHCPDCEAIRTLGPHELKARGCHLHDRDTILVLIVRCKACVATRRILPPFVLPGCRYGTSGIFAWLTGGKKKSKFGPENSTLRRWKKKYFRFTRSGASNDSRIWVRMIRANRNAHLVRAFRRPGGDGRWPNAANPTSAYSPASMSYTAPLLGTLPRPDSGWPSRE